MRPFSMSAVAVAFVAATVLGCGGTAEPQSSQKVADLHESKGRGEHTLVWHQKDTFGGTGDTTLTYHLTVR